MAPHPHSRRSSGGTDQSPFAPLASRPDAVVWRRVVARTLDVATVLMLVWVLGLFQVVALVQRVVDGLVGDGMGGSTTAVAVGVGVALAMLQEALFVTHSRGQTPGKDVMRIRVIDPGRAGVAPWRAILRWSPIGALALVRPWWLGGAVAAVAAAASLVDSRWAITDVVGRTRVVPYDRDLEDPDARRPSSRRQRRAARRADAGGDTGGDGAAPDASARRQRHRDAGMRA